MTIPISAQHRNCGARRKGNFSIDTGSSNLMPEGPHAAGKIQIVHGLVVEPGQTVLSIQAANGKTGYVKVAINANTDILEREYRRGRLSSLAYTAGRSYLSILSANGYNGPSSARLERVESADDPSGRLARKMGEAKDAIAIEDEVRRIIGIRAAAIMDEILLKSWPELGLVAKFSYGCRGSKAVWRFCQAFRASLEDLAAHWERHGWPLGSEF